VGDAFSLQAYRKARATHKWSAGVKNDRVYEHNQSGGLAETREEKSKKLKNQKEGSFNGSLSMGRDGNRAKLKSLEETGKGENETERESDVHVVTRAVYRGDDEGLLRFQTASTHLDCPKRRRTRMKRFSRNKLTEWPIR
jgi:hypothetical protein